MMPISYKNNLYNTKKHPIETVTHIIIGDTMKRKIKKENKNAGHVSGQGLRPFYDKQRSSLIYTYMQEMILGENNGT
tara:strand:- start:238 stop:468 length:231 start_codon:yes stop_codon:yes gene_type:complete